MPLVSIIMPTYNSFEFVLRSAYSVINQSYKSWELIIVDDCSTDGTLELLNKEFQGEEKVTIISNNENKGAAFSRNVAIKRAQGRFIAFLDSDDYWYANKLSIQIEYMLDRDIALSFSAYNVVDASNNMKRTVCVPNVVTYNDLLNTCVIGCLTAVYDTHVFGKSYMPDIRKRQDYALWLKLLRGGQKGYGINEPLACYCERLGSLSHNKFKVVKYNWYIYRDLEKLSLFHSIYRFLNYSIRGVLRHYFPFFSKKIGIM